MITDSPELKAVAARWMEALRRKDRDALPNLFSASENIRYLGTADGELWAGSVLRDGYADHAEEIPAFTIRNAEIEAFECGDVGWASWIGETHFDALGTWCVTRFTWVFVLENGAWKIAHAHGSNPTSNVEKIGIEHTALDKLIQAASEDYRHSGDDTATVMFTDIAGSSAIAREVGDRVWATTIKTHFEIVSAVIEQNGGRVIKTLGDGTMSTFLSARAAMQAAIAIQKQIARTSDEPRLQVRIGMHTGDVIRSDGDFFGSVVNKAARIASAASPGQILVSDNTRAMTGSTSEFEFESPISVMLRGLEGNHSISTLIVE